VVYIDHRNRFRRFNPRKINNQTNEWRRVHHDRNT
jgi:hypothetical protein